MSKELVAARRKAIAGVRQVFKPHLYESGFRTGGGKTGDLRQSRPLLLWAPRGTDGRPAMVTMSGHVLREFHGYSEFGVITDVHAGGCVTEPVRTLPLEDILMLLRWAQGHFQHGAAGPGTARAAQA